MSGGGKGSNTTEVKLPKWYEDAATQALDMSGKKAKMGYIPYMGPDVAAFSPQTVDGMQMANDFSSAFGMSPARNVSESIPPPTDFGGGIKGYSSFPLYQQSMANLKTTFPGLAKYLESFSINPVTGMLPQPNAWDEVPGGTTTPPKPGGSHGGGGSGSGSGGPKNYKSDR
jgi:hypothetical protein